MEIAKKELQFERTNPDAKKTTIRAIGKITNKIEAQTN